MNLKRAKQLRKSAKAIWPAMEQNFPPGSTWKQLYKQFKRMAKEGR